MQKFLLLCVRLSSFPSLCGVNPPFTPSPAFSLLTALSALQLASPSVLTQRVSQ